MQDALRQPGTIWFDTARYDNVNQLGYIFHTPLRVIQARTLEEVSPALALLDEAVAAGYHIAGYMAYEAAYAFLPVGSPQSLRYPLIWFGVYNAPIEVDASQAEALLEGIGKGSAALDHLAFSETYTSYDGKIRAIKHHIAEGNAYQVNFTGAVDFTYEGSPLSLYRKLRNRQHVSYGAFLNLNDVQVLSLSPELFFRREGKMITARPMKGTIERGETLADDATLSDRLVSDAKNRAENLMIVDLLRNDLSVCCEPGTVQVPALFTMESYETLMQMTSTIQGVLRPGITYTELLQSLFPCGSVTGAPKISAMQIIKDLESRPRGVYCGAIGYAAPGDTAVFSVAIRTLVLEQGRGSMGIGSGIVWDSKPDAEYQECLLKAKFLQ